MLLGNIVFSESVIYNTAKLEKISRRNRLTAILSIVAAFSLEIIFTIPFIGANTNSANFALKMFDNIMMWICEIIISSILMQILFWSWLYIQLFNGIKIKLISSFKDCNAMIQLTGIKSIRVGMTNR